MAATRLNRKPVVEDVSIGSVTVNANAMTYVSKAIPAKSGYSVGGIVGISWSHPSAIIMSASWKTGISVFVAIKSFTSSNMTENITMTVLYLPD